MAERIYINQLEANQLIDGVYTINNCQLGLTRNGKPYLKCLVSDKSGRLPARMWNASEELYESLPTDGFVRIAGQTQPYQGEIQLIIQTIAPATPTRAELAELLPSTTFSIEEMFNEVRQVLGSLSSPSLRALAEQYLNDRDLMARFVQAPAATALHHACLGGLLEHTRAVLRLAKAVLPLYESLNADLVLMGLFVHDLGKCAELQWDSGFSYSEDGLLIGHIGRGMLWLEEKAKQAAEAGHPLPEAALRVLHHIILSHHGEHEYGAVKKPATPEALMVHLLDNVDAKMYQAITAARREEPDTAARGSFTEKIWALDTRIYRPDPLADETK